MIYEFQFGWWEQAPFPALLENHTLYTFILSDSSFSNWVGSFHACSDQYSAEYSEETLYRSSGFSLCITLFTLALCFANSIPFILSSLSVLSSQLRQPILLYLCFSFMALKCHGNKWGQSRGTPCSRFIVLCCLMFGVLKTAVSHLLSFCFKFFFMWEGKFSSHYLILAKIWNIQSRVFG